MLGLIFLITLVAYRAGIYIDRRGVSQHRRKAALAATVAVNIATLIAFKYYNFFAEGFIRLLHVAGMTADAPTLDLILPVGISFYTFQAMSYVIDVYRRRLPATHDAPAFFVFISFFPQLVAGPIERATNLLPQFLRPRRRFCYRRGVEGMQLILWGLFKKMVVADNCATGVNAIFADYQTAGTVNLWLGALLFTFQIYCDFSGYSDIAIGTAKLFGIDLMKNFNLPYFSSSIADFWKRWHISLTSWFRDYLYIPMGGNRRGAAKTVRNTAVVFLVSGLWHGANLTYVVWGAYHALLYIPHIVMRRRGQPRSAQSRLPGYFRLSLMMGCTFLLVMVGWVVFRAETVGKAFDYLKYMFCSYVPAGNIGHRKALVWVAALIVIEWITRHKPNPLAASATGPWSHATVRWAGCIMLFLITLIFAGGQQEFIYFRF